jgi:two-component system response regulator AlgR
MKVLIVDDEPLARDRLSRMVARIDGYEVVGEAANGSMAIECCDSLNPDIVLLDIRMPGMDGLTAARHLSAQEEAPALIFCTAYGEYALEAFEVTATGYLLKPVNLEKLESALEKAQRLTRPQLEALDLREGSDLPDQRRNLTVTSRGSTQLIPVDDIRVLFAHQKYVTAYHLHGEALLEDSLKSLEDEFSDKFVRVHRNALVAHSFIESMEKDSDGNYSLRMSDCELMPQVSRRHVAQLRKLLQRL